MDRQQISERRPAPDKLKWQWLTAGLAAQAYAAKVTTAAVELEKLRVGHGMLSPLMFHDALAAGDIEVLVVYPHNTTLVAWGECEEGKVLNILTVSTDGDFEYGLRCIEAAALSRGANVVMSVGRAGWNKFIKAQGYETRKTIVMKKVLNDSVPKDAYSH